MPRITKPVALIATALIAVTTLTGCSSEPANNLKPVDTASPGATQSAAPIVNDGSFSSVLANSIAKVEQDGFAETQNGSDGSLFTFVYDPSLAAEQNAGIIVAEGVAIPMPANSLGQKDGEGKGALHVLFREQGLGIAPQATDTGFTFTSAAGATYAVTVKDDLVIAVSVDDPATGKIDSNITYGVTDEQRKLIQQAHASSAG